MAENNKIEDGTSINDFNNLRTIYLLFAMQTCKCDLGCLELEKRMFYDCPYCVYRIIGVELNRSLDRKRSGSQSAGIGGIITMQSTSFVFYT